MQLTLRGDLPFASLSLTHRGQQVLQRNALIDTGAASTVVSADAVGDVGIYLEPGDGLRMLRGIGGREFVFVRRVDQVALGEHRIAGFDVEIGDMNYGFEIDAIIGMDLLRATGAIINLAALSLEVSESLPW
jgi:hypothetical protein